MKQYKVIFISVTPSGALNAIIKPTDGGGNKVIRKPVDMEAEEFEDLLRQDTVVEIYEDRSVRISDMVMPFKVCKGLVGTPNKK